MMDGAGNCGWLSFTYRLHFTVGAFDNRRGGQEAVMRAEHAVFEILQFSMLDYATPRHPGDRHGSSNVRRK
jgi:hypothetical protein